MFGDLLGDLDDVRGLGGLAGESYVDKDLRTLLGEPVRGPFNLRYCGNGSLDACRASLWAAVDAGGRRARRRLGSADPATWRSDGEHDRLRARADPGHVPDHEPADVPAGARVPEQSLRHPSG